MMLATRLELEAGLSASLRLRECVDGWADQGIEVAIGGPRAYRARSSLSGAFMLFNADESSLAVL